MALVRTEPKLPSPSFVSEAAVDPSWSRLGNAGRFEIKLFMRGSYLFKDVHRSLDHLLGGAHRGRVKLIGPRRAHEVNHFLNRVDGWICHVPGFVGIRVTWFVAHHWG